MLAAVDSRVEGALLWTSGLASTTETTTRRRSAVWLEPIALAHSQTSLYWLAYIRSVLK